MTEPQILRIDDVLTIVNVSKPTLYRWIADDLFPRPVQLGPRAVGWKVEAVNQWVESRQAA